MSSNSDSRLIQDQKPLAQGRLITNAGLAAGSVPVRPTEGRAPLQPGACESVPPRSPYSSNVSAANNSHNASVVREKRLPQGTEEDSFRLFQGQPEDSVLTPRRHAPHATEDKSPMVGLPVGSLDLSDSDPDGSHIATPSRRSRQQTSEILCVDASRQTGDPDMSEVEIVVHAERSPVKIICHSPRAMETELRKGKPGSRRVDIDVVPSVSLREERQTTGKRTPVVIREKVAGSHIDPYTAVQAIPMTPPLSGRGILSSRVPNYPQPNFEDSVESETSEHPVHDVDQEDTQSVVSDNSDVCSLNEYVTGKSKPTAKSTRSADLRSASVKKAPPKLSDTAKKKKGGRVVPSRYLQAADKKAKQSLSVMLERTTTNRSTGKASKSIDVPPSARKISKKVVEDDTQGPGQKRIPDEPERPHTPDNSQVSTGGKTSTPTMDGSLYLHDIDASAIHAETSVLSVGGDHSRFETSTRSSGSRSRPRIKHDAVFPSAAVKKKSDSKVTQQQLDLMYARYLQWLYLDMKARRTLQEQEKRAMAQISSLHAENEKLRKQTGEKRQYLARLKHLNMLDQLIDVQLQGLGPVTASLPKLKRDYQGLAQALDTTRHQIPTKGIYLPDNEEQFQATLEAQFAESERLLGQISVMTRQQTPTVTSMASALEIMEKGVDGMTQELYRSKELLAASQTLATQETSLKVQSIQAVS